MNMHMFLWVVKADGMKNVYPLCKIIIIIIISSTALHVGASGSVWVKHLA